MRRESEKRGEDEENKQTDSDVFLVLVVVGNKTDMAKQRAIPKDKGREFADTIKASYIETSAKDGEGM